MPITANIIHIAKHTVKASVLAMSTESCFPACVVMGVLFLVSTSSLGIFSSGAYSQDGQLGRDKRIIGPVRKDNRGVSDAAASEQVAPERAMLRAAERGKSPTVRSEPINARCGGLRRELASRGV
jgi:hypothetical protein